jgi:hypothetical protein
MCGGKGVKMSGCNGRWRLLRYPSISLNRIESFVTFLSMHCWLFGDFVMLSICTGVYMQGLPMPEYESMIVYIQSHVQNTYIQTFGRYMCMCMCEIHVHVFG